MIISLTAVTLHWPISTTAPPFYRRRSAMPPFPGWCMPGGIGRRLSVLPVCAPNSPWPRGRGSFTHTLAKLDVATEMCQHILYQLLCVGDWSRPSAMKRAWVLCLFPRGRNFSSSWTTSSDRATRRISSKRLCSWAATCTLSSWLPIPWRNWSKTISSLAW